MTRTNLHRDCASIEVVYAFMFVNVVQSMLMFLMWFKYDELVSVLVN